MGFYWVREGGSTEATGHLETQEKAEDSSFRDKNQAGQHLHEKILNVAPIGAWS